MGKELYAAILLYTGNSIYASLNKVLRAEDRRAAKKYFSYLRLFLEAMPQPGVGLSLSANIHLNVLNNSYDRMCL